MDLATAPSPKNKAIQLKELPSHRAIARYLHGPPQHGALIVAGVAGGAAAHLPLAGLLGLRAPRPHTGCTREAAAAHGREPAEPRADVAEPRVRRPVLNRLTDLMAYHPAGRSRPTRCWRGKRARCCLWSTSCAASWAAASSARQQGQSAPVGSAAPARGRCLYYPLATAAAPGSSALPGRGPGTARPATASGAPARRLQSRRFPHVPFGHPATVIVMHRFPAWMPSLFRVSDLIVRISEAGERP